MTSDSKRPDFGEDTEDTITDLPKNVIDRILELLTVEDAARSSILSTRWRYNWAMLPNLVLDKRFCNKLAENSQSIFTETVDKILMQHVGDIVKFDVDVSGIYLSSDAHIDRWLLYVTRNGVKHLTFNMSNNTTYKLPSYIFNCQTLTHLKLFNCVFKLPTSFPGFQNLSDLFLEKVTFVPTTEFCVIKAPILASLNLRFCDGIQYLSVVSSKLKCLLVRESHYLKLNCFTNCKNLRVLLLLGRVVDNLKYVERSDLEKLLLSLPTLEILQLDSFFIELLSAGTAPKYPFVLNCVCALSLSVDFGKLGQTSCTLHLIKCSHNLSDLEIWVTGTGDDTDAVMRYLDTPVCLDQPLDKLKRVSIRHFTGSKTELHLVKLLFACTPSLVRMSIYQRRAAKELWNVAVELMRFPRASPKAELIYLRTGN